MNGAPVLWDSQQVKALAERLKRCPAVARIDGGHGEEAETLAQSFSDLEQSFRAYLDVHLPQPVASGVEDDAFEAALFDIGEELRHVLYHVRDSRFFRYLFPEDQSS